MHKSQKIIRKIKNGYCLDNGILRRELDCRAGAPVTCCMVNHLTRRCVKLQSREWEISVAGRRTPLKAGDFSVVGSDITVDGNALATLSIKLIARRAGVELTVRYQIAPDWFFTRKNIRIDSGGDIVRDIAVESFDMPGARLGIGGFGQPVFLDDDMFLGLEYPAGYNNIIKSATVRLMHYPGRSGVVESKTAVWGVCPDTENNRIRDWFLKYIDLNRPRVPCRLHTQYCVPPSRSPTIKGWNLATAKRIFKDQGLSVDALYVHSGRNVYDPQSVSKLLPPDQQYPCLDELREQARRMLGAKLGFHINTGGGRASADHAWFRKNFDMISPRYYCMADPRVKSALQCNMFELIEKYDAEVLSFDWLWWRTAWECPHGGHRGHIRGAKYGREAITDAFIEMVAAWRRAKPDIVIEDMEVELSPWWLFYADALWSYAGEGPGTTHALVDASLRGWRKNTVFPMNAVWYAVNPPYGWGPQPWRHPDAALWTPERLARHEEDLKAGLTMTAGKTPPREWADNVIMGFLRGSQVNEWFYFIENLTATERRLYAEIMHWALARQKILLANTAFVLGNPAHDQTYGFAHFMEDNRGVVGIYNPCPWRTESVRLLLDETAHFHRAGGAVSLEVVYPYQKKLPGSVAYGDSVELAVPGKSLVVLETRPARQTRRGRVQGFDISHPFDAHRDTIIRNCRQRRVPGRDNCTEIIFEIGTVRQERVRVYALTETPYNNHILNVPGARAAYRKAFNNTRRRFAKTGKRWILQRVLECRMAGMYAALRHSGAVGGDIASVLVNGQPVEIEHGSSILNRVTRMGRHPVRYVRPYAFTRVSMAKPLKSGQVRIVVQTKYAHAKCHVWLELERSTGVPVQPAKRGKLPGDWRHVSRPVIELPKTEDRRA